MHFLVFFGALNTLRDPWVQGHPGTRYGTRGCRAIRGHVTGPVGTGRPRAHFGTCGSRVLVASCGSRAAPLSGWIGREGGGREGGREGQGQGKQGVREDGGREG